MGSQRSDAFDETRVPRFARNDPGISLGMTGSTHDQRI